MAYEDNARRVLPAQLRRESSSADSADVASDPEQDAVLTGKLFDDIRLIGIENLVSSEAQLQQDIFALSQSDCKRGGYFVEIGAADGIMLSNSYFLEMKFGWKGIVVEPGHCWHAALRDNRRCAIDTSCVWGMSGETVSFRQYDAMPEYSGVASSVSSDLTGRIIGKETPTIYEVATISLLDLLDRHDAPPMIDYLSIDTEGSELEILKAFDFARYDVRVITVEHNYTPQREELNGLLARQGYRRCLTSISKWDDWYVKEAD